MVEYNSTDNVKAGLPLGGIGAGKVEINNKGKMVNLTIFNNWNKPLQIVRGFHVFIIPEDMEGFFVETQPSVLHMQDRGCELHYYGSYPFLRLVPYNRPQIEVTAFTALIPGKIEDSSLPAFGIRVRTNERKVVKVAISLPNLIGTSIRGRFNKEVDGGVMFLTENTSSIDPSYGDMTLITDKPLKIIPQNSINVDVNTTIKGGHSKIDFEDGNIWRRIERGDEIESIKGSARGMWDDFGGIVVADLKEGEAKFVVSWYFNNPWIYYPYRHFYATRFRNSLDVGEYFLKNFDEFYDNSKQFCKGDDSLPEWLIDSMCNSAYILSSSTWLDDKGRFSIFESPENFPVLGTIGGLTYEAGSLPVLLDFPELEKAFLTVLANAIDDSGYVPHDLGLFSLDAPLDGTTSPPRWKDLNPSFILLVYRYYKLTNDREFLEKIYPTLKAVLLWEVSRDRDGDGLPELEGTGDTSFDVTYIEGTDSYTSTLFLASLYAYREILNILKIEPSDYVDKLIERAEKSLSTMYNGKYFLAWKGLPDVGDALFLGQIIGLWWSITTGLPIFPEREKVISILNNICKVNGAASHICTPNLVSSDGKVISLSPQTEGSWPRLVMSLAPLAIEYEMDCLLEAVQKEWNTIVKDGMVWNQPSRINARTGVPDIYLDHYIGSPALWSVALFMKLNGNVKSTRNT
ncbi:hypothetical protein HS7_21220 [Sulfolobales archaeon HS-7]|nr:hypothetical protein HS7_21220 [Sulfolobales archaeon HS-7]